MERLPKGIYNPEFREQAVRELVHHRRYRTRAQATQEITEYIDIFYNRQRKQARLGYLSPAAFTRQYYENKLAP